MKTFIVTYTSGYHGLSIMVINEKDIEAAKIVADEVGAWPDFEIEELDLTRRGVVFEEHS